MILILIFGLIFGGMALTYQFQKEEEERIKERSRLTALAIHRARIQRELNEEQRQ